METYVYAVAYDHHQHTQGSHEHAPVRVQSPCQLLGGSHTIPHTVLLDSTGACSPILFSLLEEHSKRSRYQREPLHPLVTSAAN